MYGTSLSSSVSACEHLQPKGTFSLATIIYCLKQGPNLKLGAKDFIETGQRYKYLGPTFASREDCSSDKQ